MDMDQGSSDPTRFVMGPINAVYAVSARLRAHQLMFANSVPDELLQQASAGGWLWWMSEWHSCSAAYTASVEDKGLETGQRDWLLTSFNQGGLSRDAKMPKLMRQIWLVVKLGENIVRLA
jgi:hypothetical protein